MYSFGLERTRRIRTFGLGVLAGRGSLLVGLGLVALLVALAGLPFIGLLASSFSVTGVPSRFAFTLANYERVLGDARTYELLLTSIAFSAASMALGLLIGAPLAWFVERTRVPGKNIIRAIVFAQVAVPPVLIAMSWALLLSPKIGILNEALRSLAGQGAVLNIYSFGGIVFVQALAFVPLVFVVLSPALRNIDASFEEAALLCGASPIVAMRDVSLPLLRPALLVAALYGFVTGLLTFDVPATLGIPGGIFVFSSEIYFSVQRFAIPRYGDAAVLSLIALVLAVGAGGLYLRATRQAGRFATFSGRFSSHELRVGGVTRVLGFAWLSLYLACGLVLPIAVMSWSSLLPFIGKLSTAQLTQVGFGNYGEAFASPSFVAAVRNTALNSTLAATICTALAVVIALAVVKARVPFRGLIDALALVPLVIPGVILGLSLQYAYITIPFIPIYGTLWILTLSHVTAGLPFGTRTTEAAVAQVHPEIEEAARTSGAGPLRALRGITLPIVLPALAFLWLWTFVHSVRDLSTSVMLYSPKSPVLANLLWQLWDYGNLTTGAAVATLLLLGLFAIAVVALVVLGRSRTSAGLQ